jgi:hypothetical protein
MAKRKHSLARSSGNVFRDLGFSPEESEHSDPRPDSDRESPQGTWSQTGAGGQAPSGDAAEGERPTEGPHRPVQHRYTD